MADFRLFDSLSSMEKAAAKEALAFLGETGCLKAYTELLTRQLAEDSHGLSDEELFAAIRRVRADTQGYMALHHYGLRLAQELKGQLNETHE